MEIASLHPCARVKVYCSLVNMPPNPVTAGLMLLIRSKSRRHFRREGLSTEGGVADKASWNLVAWFSGSRKIYATVSISQMRTVFILDHTASPCHRLFLEIGYFWWVLVVMLVMKTQFLYVIHDIPCSSIWLGHPGWQKWSFPGTRPPVPMLWIVVD